MDANANGAANAASDPSDKGRPMVAIPSIIQGVVKHFHDNLPACVEGTRRRSERFHDDKKMLMQICQNQAATEKVLLDLIGVLESLKIANFGDDLNRTHQWQAQSDLLVLQVMHGGLSTYRHSPKGAQGSGNGSSPALSEHVIEKLFDFLVTHYVGRRLSGYMQRELRFQASEVLQEASSISFPQILECIKKVFTTVLDSRFDSGDSTLGVIGSLKPDTMQLSQLLGVIKGCCPKMKKQSLKRMAPALYTCLCSWIEAHEEEACMVFSGQHQISMDESASQIFVAMEKLGSKNKRKYILWPAQVLLLLLCPNSHVEQSTKPVVSRRFSVLPMSISGAGSGAWERFKGFKTAVSEALRNPLLLLPAMHCLLDAYKALVLQHQKNMLNPSNTAAVAIQEWLAPCIPKMQELLLDVNNTYDPKQEFPLGVQRDDDASIAREHMKQIAYFWVVLPIEAESAAKPSQLLKATTSPVHVQVAMKTIRGVLKRKEGTSGMSVESVSQDIGCSVSETCAFIQNCLVEHRENTLQYVAIQNMPASQLQGIQVQNLKESCVIVMNCLSTLAKLPDLAIGLGQNGPAGLSAPCNNVLNAMHHAAPEYAWVTSATGATWILVWIMDLFIQLCSYPRSEANCNLLLYCKINLKSLFAPKTLIAWVEDDCIAGIWLLTSMVYDNLASACLDPEVPIETLLDLVSVLTHITECTSKVLSARSSEKIDCLPGPILTLRARILARVDTMIMVLSCTGSPVLVDKVSRFCQSILNHLQSLGPLERQDHSFDENIDFYIAAEKLRGSVRTAMRSHFSLLSKSTPAVLDAWRHVLGRWQACKARMGFAREADASLQVSSEEESEWDSYTCFLVAMCKHCMSSKADAMSPPPLFCLQQATIPPQSMTVTAFLHECLVLFNSASQTARDMMKRDLGQHVSSELYEQLFVLMLRHPSLAPFHQASGNGALSSDKKDLQMAEVSIGICKAIAQRLATTLNRTSRQAYADVTKACCRCVGSANPSKIGSNVARFLQKKACQLVEVQAQRRDVLSFEDDESYWSELLKMFADWALKLPSDAQQGEAKVNTAHDSEKAFMHIISVLLPIISLHDESVTVSSTRKQDMVRFFNFLTGSLQKLIGSESTTGTSQLELDVIHGIITLLRYSPDIGLDAITKMSMQGSDRQRTMFMKILCGLLSERQEFEEEQKDESDEAKFRKIIELIVAPDHLVFFALCKTVDVAEADALAGVLVRASQLYDCALSNINALIVEEASSTAPHAAGTLFRQNSMASRCCRVVAKMAGAQYLKEHLESVVAAALAFDEGSIEVDPLKLPEGQTSTDGAVFRLKELCDMALDALMKSVHSCPLPIRQLCNSLRTAVSRTHPGSENIAVGGFFFLRFVNPALTAPESAGMVDQVPSPSKRRVLILITKILQNLANGVSQFKESYMEPLQEYLIGRQGAIEGLFNQLCQAPESLQDSVNDFSPGKRSDSHDDSTDPLPQLSAEDANALHLHLASYIDDINDAFLREVALRAETLATVMSSSPQEANHQNGSHLTDPNCLMDAVQSLGSPPTNKYRPASHLNPAHSDESYTEYENFLSERSQVSTEGIKARKLFYAHGKSKAGNPVLFYIARRKDSTMQEEQWVLHILRTLKSVPGPFELVIDASMFTLLHEPSTGGLNTLKSLIPESITARICHVYIVMPSPAFMQFASKFKRATNFVKRFFQIENSFPVSTFEKVSRLFDHIPRSDLDLPQETLEVESDVQSVFRNVTVDRADSSVFIGPEYFQIHTRKLAPFSTKPVTCVDVISMAHVKFHDTNPSKPAAAVKFFIQGRRNPLVVKCPEKQRIISAMANTTTFSSNKTSVSQTQVISRVYLIGLLNVNHSSAVVRAQSITLLSKAQVAFGILESFDFSPDSTVYPPQNFVAMSLQLSSSLAEADPRLSLEFLQQALTLFPNMDSGGKHLLLEIIEPWFEPFVKCMDSESDEAGRSVYTSTLAFITELTLLVAMEGGGSSVNLANRSESTIGGGREDLTLYHVMLYQIWPKVASSAESCREVMLGLMRRLRAGVNEETVKNLADLISLVNYKQPKVVGQVILDEFDDIIDDTCSISLSGLSSLESVVPSLNNVLDRAALLGFLLKLISCNNKYLAIERLAHVLYVVCFFSGNMVQPSTQASFYTSLLNIGGCHQSQIDSNALVSALANDAMRIRFLGSASIQAQSSMNYTSDASKRKLLAKIETVEFVTTAFNDVLHSLNQKLQPFSINGKSQKELFVDHIRAVCKKQPVTLMQARSIVSLGCITNPVSMVDPDITQLLHSLKNALVVGKEQTNAVISDELARSIISCLSKLSSGLTDDAALIPPFLCFGMAIMQVDGLHEAGSRLLCSLLNSKANQGALQSSQLQDLVAKELSSNDRLEKAFKQLTHLCKVQYNQLLPDHKQEQNGLLHFAIVTSCLPLLASNRTQPHARHLLLTLFDCCLNQRMQVGGEQDVYGCIIYLTGLWASLQPRDIESRLMRIRVRADVGLGPASPMLSDGSGSFQSSIDSSNQLCSHISASIEGGPPDSLTRAPDKPVSQADEPTSNLGGWVNDSGKQRSMQSNISKKLQAIIEDSGMLQSELHATLYAALLSNILAKANDFQSTNVHHLLYRMVPVAPKAFSPVAVDLLNSFQTAYFNSTEPTVRQSSSAALRKAMNEFSKFDVEAENSRLTRLLKNASFQGILPGNLRDQTGIWPVITQVVDAIIISIYTFKDSQKPNSTSPGTK